MIASMRDQMKEGLADLRRTVSVLRARALMVGDLWGTACNASSSVDSAAEITPPTRHETTARVWTTVCCLCCFN